MNSQRENIFDIEDSHLYGCGISSYTVGHSMMVIRAAKHGDPTHKDNFFLIFGGVIYLECPVSWGGVNFVLGSDEECRALCQSIGNDVERGLREKLPKLYKLKLYERERELKIIAEGAKKSKEFPTWLK